MPRVKQRTPELRNRVLEVALAALSEEGISRFTTRRVAERAGTSLPAVYELFGDKAGLLRAMVFDGFRRLGGELERVPLTDDPVVDLERLVPVFRSFVRANPRLAHLMFSRPFADLEPDPDDAAAGAAVRDAFTSRVRRCVDAGLLTGDVSDIAHAVLAMAQGLAAQEMARWLGPSARDVERRWAVGVRALLDGLRPD